MSVTFYTDVNGDDEFDVNMANSNAVMVAGALGIDLGDELVGSMPGSDFLGYCLIALATERDDSVVYSSEMFPGRPGARMIDCGLREGYVTERLTDLHELALLAASKNQKVYWA